MDLVGEFEPKNQVLGDFVLKSYSDNRDVIAGQMARLCSKFASVVNEASYHILLTVEVMGCAEQCYAEQILIDDFRIA